MPELQLSSTVSKWVREIDLYDRESQKWRKSSRKIIERYKDEDKIDDMRSVYSRFNILWSNVQTLQPALFAQNPKVNVERRFQDDDDVGRISSDVLERAASYFVDDHFHQVMKECVLDRLLPGRATIWVRYLPHIGTATETENDGPEITDDASEEEGEDSTTPEELYGEEVIGDYVDWRDFGHNWARTWAEVTMVYRAVYMGRTELVKRFGDKGKDVPLSYSPEKLNDEKIPEANKKAIVYELWDKVSKKAYWINKETVDPLDEQDDPLRLKGFFPCPPPLYATLSNDSLIPVPDYVEYQDQARELDDLTQRIDAITKCIKVAGVYDSSAQGLSRILNEGVENQLIPVDQWAVFAEKGGLAGAISFLPLQDIVQALLALYEAREKVKQDLYEITGISDIIRGASKPNETATAQQIKSNYATLRLDNSQQEVQRFARDWIRIMAEIIAEHFSLETIKNISGVKLLTDAEKQQIQMQMQQQQAAMQQYQQVAQAAQQQGMQPPPPPQQMPPLTEEQQELMENPTWEQVHALLTDDTMRCYRIDIETDSTIKQDQTEDRNARVEFLSAVGGFMQQLVAVEDPSLKPLAMQMLMFGVRGFKAGRELETAFKVAIKKMQKEAENPQPPQDPKIMEAQAQLQIKEKESQSTIQMKQMEFKAEQAMDQQKLEHEKQMSIIKLQNDKELQQIKIQGELEIERMRVASDERIEGQKALVAVATAEDKNGSS